MTITKIISYLNKTSVHKLSYKSLGWCIVTQRNGTRIKFYDGMDERLFFKLIYSILIHNKKKATN